MYKIEDCIIRRAKIADLKAIAELYKQQGWFGENNSVELMKRNFNPRSNRDFLLVAELEGNVIGTVMANTSCALAFDCKRFMTFDYLVVKKEFWRKGIGAKLIQTLVEFAKNHHYESIWAVSSADKKNAHVFYEKQGFNDSVKGFRLTI